jgi:hypothetical protein
MDLPRAGLPETGESMKKRPWTTVGSTAVVLALTAVPLASVFSAQEPPTFSDWSAPVNIGPPVNTNLAEIAPVLSTDGLSLYFVRTANAGGFGGMDIWVSQRASIDDPWGGPLNLGSTINTNADDFGPSLTLDGHRLYFASNRPGVGGQDLYVSRRRNKQDDFGWQPAVNLDGINTVANELLAAHFEDDLTGITTLYFASNRSGGPGGDDIYVSTLLPDETFSRRSGGTDWKSSSPRLESGLTADLICGYRRAPARQTPGRFR